MKIFYGFKNIPSGLLSGGVITIGVFDGVHLGHALLLRRARERALKLSVKSAVITFCPHPAKSAFICTLEKRLKLIAEKGIDYCVVVRFTRKFSQITPFKFISEIIIPKLNPRYILVGENFTFGRNAQGSARLLDKLSSRFGFSLEEVNIRRVKNMAVSSTLIRGLIRKGELSKVQRLLGRRFDLEGKVIRARKFGRTLGFPTANIDYHNEILPPDGVYAARVKVGSMVKKGACYIGTTPTFGKSLKRSVEVFIFGFHKSIYGSFIEIELLKYIRRDKKFARRTDLITAIKRDIAAIKNVLK